MLYSPHHAPPSHPIPPPKKISSRWLTPLAHLYKSTMLSALLLVAAAALWIAPAAAATTSGNLLRQPPHHPRPRPHHPDRLHLFRLRKNPLLSSRHHASPPPRTRRRRPSRAPSRTTRPAEHSHWDYGAPARPFPTASASIGNPTPTPRTAVDRPESRRHRPGIESSTTYGTIPTRPPPCFPPSSPESGSSVSPIAGVNSASIAAAAPPATTTSAPTPPSPTAPNAVPPFPAKKSLPQSTPPPSKTPEHRMAIRWPPRRRYTPHTPYPNSPSNPPQKNTPLKLLIRITILLITYPASPHPSRA